MTKKKSQTTSALAHSVPTSEWSKTREAERIQYSSEPPARSAWKTQGTYEGKELQYRGKVKSEKIFLTGRPL